MEQKIPAGRFKATCLRLLDEVARHRTEILITKRGKPVARLVPVRSARPKLFGRMAGSMDIVGDIVAPTSEKWDAEV